MEFTGSFLSILDYFLGFLKIGKTFELNCFRERGSIISVRMLRMLTILNEDDNGI